MPSFSKVLLTAVLVTFAAAAPYPQLHGEGAAADALFTSTDNGIGYSTENLENTIANTIKPGSAPTGNTGAGSDNTGTGGSKSRRQADKIAKGAQNIANALGQGQATESLTGEVEGLDGTLTDGAANAGAEVGNLEAGTLEGITATPGRV